MAAAIAPLPVLAQQASPLRIGMVGAGREGSTLGTLWAKAGSQVMFSSRHPEELKSLVDGIGPAAQAGTVEQAVTFGDVVAIVVPYTAMQQIGNDYGAAIAGKVLVLDVSNPIAQRDGEETGKCIGTDGDYKAVVARVVGFVEAPSLGLDLPLDIRGTAFQQRVWQVLQEIPVGQTVSYSDIARRIGSPKAARAVAEACAANNIAVGIPCHRVVRNNGSLSGYAWGVERKRALLDRERRRT